MSNAQQSSAFSPAAFIHLAASISDTSPVAPSDLFPLALGHPEQDGEFIDTLSPQQGVHMPTQGGGPLQSHA